MRIKYLLFGLLSTLLIVTSCEKKDMMEQVRLFRPTIAGQLIADSNAIDIGWQSIKAASGYVVQISRDTFKTIDVSVNVADTNRVLVQNLRWDQLYQIQVRALATDSMFNSKFSNLGAIKTPKFPTILNSPTIADVSDEAIRMSWQTSGAAVTSIKLLLASDSSLVKDVPLTSADVTAQFKIITGLKGGTTYIGMLYSGTRLRGSDLYTTKQAISGNVIDLRGITDRPSVLIDTLPLIDPGSTVILKRGQTYDVTTSLLLTKSVKIQGGTDITIPQQPILNMPSNFNIAAGSTIEFITFEDVYLKGTDPASKYVFNINNTCVLGRITFENVVAESFRGLIRFQAGVSARTLSANRSVIFNIGNYGVFNVDNVGSKADSIIITNSTIYQADKIITSRQNAVSVIFSNNTVNDAPLTNNYLIDFSTGGTNNVTGEVTVKNNILGVGRASNNVTAVKGIRVGSGSIVTANNYSTADYNVTATSAFAIPDLIPYTRPSTQLWQSPSTGNFKIVDAAFPGTATAGDPRWK